MTQAHAPGARQAAEWNGATGRRWVERQAFMDAFMAPVSDALLAAAALRPGLDVIDVGCGSGATTLAIAEKVSPGGRVTGLDISAPLLARARERVPAGAAIAFIEGDAMVLALAPAAADLLFSRFGVMFFADPVRAFANMRRGLKPGGRVCFACWRAPRFSQWLTVPMDALRPLLPPAPAADPDAPGPYALAEAARVNRILDEAGFVSVSVQPLDIELDVAAGGGIEAAVASTLAIGPSARALADQTPEVRAAAIAALRRAFAPFERDGRIRLGAAIWLVTAVNP